MIDMLKQALTYADSARYVLFDSWFCFPGILLKIKGLGLHTIAMMKSMKTGLKSFLCMEIGYTISGKKFSL